MLLPSAAVPRDRTATAAAPATCRPMSPLFTAAPCIKGQIVWSHSWRCAHANVGGMSSHHPIDPSTIRAYLGDDASDLLHEYFDPGFGSSSFTGGRFERFAGGGDRSETVNVIDSNDIVAVSLLSVRIPGRAALEILDTRRDEFAQLLSAIPSDVDLWDAPADAVAPGSPADQLWRLLEQLPGSGWVTAGKLMARKRPRLIPVYDRVVKAALGRPARDGTWWQDLREVLCSDPSLVTRLSELRDAASLAEVSLLRVLDVAIWMKEHGRPEPTRDAEE